MLYNVCVDHIFIFVKELCLCFSVMLPVGVGFACNK